MKPLLFLLVLAVLLGCSGTVGEKMPNPKRISEINHFNIIVALDLSNRLDPALNPRPLADEQIIKVLLANIYPTILNHGRIEGQQDRYSIEVVNKRLLSAFDVDASALALNFSMFEKQLDRIEYLKNKGKSRTFSNDTARMLAAYRTILKHSRVNHHGADIWTFLKEDITPNKISRAQDTLTYDGTKFNVRFRNVLILLTDGYVEAGLYGAKGCRPSDDRQCYYLSQNRISKFRDAFLRSGSTNLTSFFKDGRYGIIPVENDALADMEVLVLELNDRSKGLGGSATVHPTDFEIMTLFWKDWLEKSRVKRVELWPTLSREEEVKEVILNFLGVANNKQK